MRVLVIDPNSVRPAEQAKATALAACGLGVTLLAPWRSRENYQTLRARVPAQAAYRLVLGHLVGKPPNRTLFLSGLRQALTPPPEAVLALADENFWLTAQALLFARLLAPRAAFVCHSWRNIYFHRGFHPQPWPLLYELDTWLEGRVFMRTAAIVARNRQARTVLRRRGYAGPVAYIPWAVDTHLFQPPQAGASRPSRPYTVGFVGRFSAEKGIDDLLAASRAMSAPHRLLLVGGGPLEPGLRAQAGQEGQGRLELVPLVDHQEMPGIYARMDALVLPARAVGYEKEQFGRVLAEAMACGVPVVGSDVGAIPEVIGQAGLVFPQGRPLALARALDELADPRLRNVLSLRGRQRAAERFSWAAWALHTAQLLENLALDRPPRQRAVAA